MELFVNVALCSPINLISLCTGGGGLDIGIGLALPDAHPVVLVEREAFSVAHLVAAIEAGRMAPAPIWSDVRTFDGRPWRGLVDGLIGGIPCQAHSLAGKKRGSLDERDLWSPARRIIVQCRPWFVVIENVEGMLSPGDDEIAGAERVIRDLRKLGFAVEAGLFSASEVGATHQRNRVFIVAVADADRRQPPRRSTIGREASGWRPHDEPAGPGAGLPVELADALCSGAGAGPEPSTPSDDAGGARRRRGAQPRNDGGDLAHTHDARSPIDRSEPSVSRSQCETLERVRGTVDDAPRLGDRPVSIQQGRQGQSGPDAAGASAIMGDAIGCGHDRRPDDAQRGSIERAIAERTSRDSFPCLFPPGPSDLDGWRRVLEDSPHLVPAVRRMADGVAARLDLAGPHAARIERLRMLGNGVVPLQAAYAFRTLVTRLAAAGSAGAVHLVRMMELG